MEGRDDLGRGLERVTPVEDVSDVRKRIYSEETLWNSVTWKRGRYR